MAKERYIRKKDNNYVLIWTPILGARDDMVECDRQGRELSVLREKEEAEAIQADVVIKPPPPAPPKPEVDLESLDKGELLSIADTMGLRIHPAAKIETIIRKIREAEAKEG